MEFRDLIGRVNAKFGTEFASELVIQSTQPEIGWHAMPNTLRESIKADIAARFEEQLDTRNNLALVSGL